MVSSGSLWMSNGHLVGFTFGFANTYGNGQGTGLREQAGLGNQNLAGASILVFTCYGFSLSCSIKGGTGVVSYRRVVVLFLSLLTSTERMVWYFFAKGWYILFFFLSFALLSLLILFLGM